MIFGRWWRPVLRDDVERARWMMHAPEPPLAFLGDPLPRWVDRRAVIIGPGEVRRYEEAEWRDALVIVEQGEVVLEWTRAGRTTFRAGDVLWLVDVPVRRICNDGDDDAVLVAISRRRSPRRRSPR